MSVFYTGGVSCFRFLSISVKVNLMTTINSLTTSLYVSQTTISISSTSATRSDKEEQRPTVSGKGEGHGRHHHHGGAFMQNVVQTLKSFGLNFPGKGGDAASDEQSNEGNGEQTNSGNLGQILQTFLHDLREVLKQGGLTQNGTVKADDANAKPTPEKQSTQPSSGSTSTPPKSTSSSASVKTDAAQSVTTTPVVSTTAQDSSAGNTIKPSSQVTSSTATPTKPAPRATVADIGQALHSFLHELRQALRSSEDRRHGSVDEEDGRDSRGFGRHGYGKFSDKLQDLITALSDKSGAVGDKYKELQDSFNDLVGMLATTNNGKKPTLVEFLNKLAGNANNDAPAPTAAGSIVSAVA